MFIKTSNSEQMWGLLSHLSVFSILLLPFSNFIFLIAVWLFFKGKSQFIIANCKEAINFQLTCLIAGFICWLLSYIFIGAFIAAFWFSYAFVVIIMACVKSSKGEVFKYNFSFRFIK